MKVKKKILLLKQALKSWPPRVQIPGLRCKTSTNLFSLLLITYEFIHLFFKKLFYGGNAYIYIHLIPFFIVALWLSNFLQ